MIFQVGYLFAVHAAGVELFRQLLPLLLQMSQPVLDELQLSNDFICHAAFLVGELFSRDGMTVSLVQVDENGVEVPYVPEDEAESEESEAEASDSDA